MLKLRRSRRAVIAVQMVALWILGSLLLPAMYVAILLMMFDLTGGEVVAWEVTFLVACYAYVLLVIMATRDVSRFGANWYGRAGWAALVFGVGTAGWWEGVPIVQHWELGALRSWLLIVLLGGVPFVAVAGVLLRTDPAEA